MFRKILFLFGNICGNPNKKKQFSKKKSLISQKTGKTDLTTNNIKTNLTSKKQNINPLEHGEANYTINNVKIANKKNIRSISHQKNNSIINNSNCKITINQTNCKSVINNINNKPIIQKMCVNNPIINKKKSCTTYDTMDGKSINDTNMRNNQSNILMSKYSVQDNPSTTNINVNKIEPMQNNDILNNIANKPIFNNFIAESKKKTTNDEKYCYNSYHSTTNILKQTINADDLDWLMDSISNSVFKLDTDLHNIYIENHIDTKVIKKMPNASNMPSCTEDFLDRYCYCRQKSNHLLYWVIIKASYKILNILKNRMKIYEHWRIIFCFYWVWDNINKTPVELTEFLDFFNKIIPWLQNPKTLTDEETCQIKEIFEVFLQDINMLSYYIACNLWEKNKNFREIVISKVTEVPVSSTGNFNLTYKNHAVKIVSYMKKIIMDVNYR